MTEPGFTPVTEADLPLLVQWLASPHWQEWWDDDPAAEIRNWREMLAGRDSTRPFLILQDGSPIGYVQSWLIRDARIEPWLTSAPWVLELADDTVGVDISIGPAGLLSQGLGSRALAGFVARLRAEGHQNIIIDPDPANARAVRAYEKAGFRVIPEFEGRTGDSLLMRHHKESETA